ncbi:MAG TPA: hypothetical protein VFL98_01100 [Candidatus Paceibacterota bacterium]|nr:hypothetical protein [Candidatus Paceibacterota bacterium]
MNGAFEDWTDLMARVPGITAGIGQEIRAAGLTIGEVPDETREGEAHGES